MKAIKTVEEYRTIMLQIMEYVDGICRQNGLNCYLSGGTLLGAVRNKGFIPWDDDTDMMMLRPEYEMLTRLINQDDSPFMVMRISNNKEYYYPFAKIIDTRTGIKEDDRLSIKRAGIGVDLFPIERLSDDRKKTVAQFRFQKFLRKRFDSFCCVNKTVISSKVLGFLYRRILRFLSWLMEYNANRRQPSTSSRIACVVWGYGIKEIIPARALHKAIDIEFEGRSFMAPVGYDRYLSGLYGDYMTPPPKAKRHNEHRARAWYR